MKINEIFMSLNGESAYAGLPTVFVRTYGCNIKCNFCDTLYAIEGNEYKELTVDDVVKTVESFQCKRVTVTGGEPLLQKDMPELIEALLKLRYEIEIETNGAVDVEPFLKYPNTLITMDWKCTGSGMNHKMIDKNLHILRPTDVVKFVVGDEVDLKEMEEVSLMTPAQTYVSPVFGRIEPKTIAEYIIDNHLNDVRMQLQQHKIIWPADMRGV